MNSVLRSLSLLTLPAFFTLASAASAQTSNLVAQPGSPSPMNISISHGPQVKDDLFAGTEVFSKGAKDVTEINLDPDMLSSVAGGKRELARKLNFMIVRTYEYDKPGMFRMEDVETFRKRLMDGSWNCFIHTRSKDESTDICKRVLADHETNELVIMTVEPKELTFIHMSGRMSLAELEKLGNAPSGGAVQLEKHDE